MDFASHLNVMHDVYLRRGVVCANDRQTLYKCTLRMKHDEACVLYKDLCSHYVGGSNHVCTRLTHTYQWQFIRGIVEIGSVMDMLADATYMSETERLDKFSRQSREFVVQREKQRRDSDVCATWSRFRFESRDANLLAFEHVVRRLSSEPNPPAPWQQVILASEDELLRKPPSFFPSVSFHELSLEEKRALAHKYTTVYRILPAATRISFKELLQDIYASTVTSVATCDVEIANDKKSCCILQ